MKWSDEAWMRTGELYEQIIQMPFIQELKAGTLPLSKFQFYMQQDARYLEHFSRTLAHIGSRSSMGALALDFFGFATQALLVEKALHKNYFDIFGIHDNHPDNDMQPICHHYVHYLKSVASFEDFPSSIAAVLPCFGIYQKVGEYIAQATITADHPYKAWIDTYSGKDFREVMRRAYRYADDVAPIYTMEIREKMWDTFEQSMRMEYLFWDAAYSGIRWPENKVFSKPV